MAKHYITKTLNSYPLALPTDRIFMRYSKLLLNSQLLKREILNSHVSMRFNSSRVFICLILDTFSVAIT